MLTESDSKKGKVNENEYSKGEFQNCLNDKAKGNRKLSPDLDNLIERHGYTESDIINYFMQRRSKLWMRLLSSDWFSCFLQYSNLKDIVNLDTAFCSHSIRPIWLNLVNDFSITVEFMNNMLVDEVTNWLVLKHIHPKELSFRYSGPKDSYEVLFDATVFQLTKNSPNLKRLSIKSKSRWWTYFTVNEKLFPYTAEFCTKLEYLEMINVDIPDNGIEILSKTCRNLKRIAFSNVCCKGMDKLLKVNPSILSLDLHLRITTENFPMLGEILEILGLHCPLLQICRIKGIIKHITDAQIETFTKGCHNLKELCLHYLSENPSLHVFHKLLNSLGSHNLALELISVGKDYDDDDDEVEVNYNNTVLTTEQTQSLQCLSNGCPLLKEIILGKCKLSTSDVSYLVNHSIHLETLKLSYCNICDDGLIITKEADKLKYLKRLGLSFNRNITDESIINLIKGCHNLELIAITKCLKLTGTSLFNIAANCPNLRKIFLSFLKVNVTISGLMELLKYCPKLVEILSKYPIPVYVNNELNRRKLTMISTLS